MTHSDQAIKGGCVTWRSQPVPGTGTLAVIYPGGKTTYPYCRVMRSCFFLNYLSVSGLEIQGVHQELKSSR